MTIDFGLSLTAGPKQGDINTWHEDLDIVLPQFSGHFRSVWMTDHFFWDDAPTHEAWTTISFLAARYPDFEFGPIVLGQSYRNPALLAKMAATLQVLSEGRFIMGIGAGWKENEYRAYDYPYPRAGVRIAQLKDTLEIMTRLWTEPGQITYHGDHYKVVDAWCEPKPNPRIPILVGGGGKKTTRLAVQYADIWNMPDAPWHEFSKRIDYIKQHGDELDRDPASLRLSWFGRLAVGKTAAEALELGGGKWTPENAFVGTVEQVVEQMQPFVEAGVDYFMPVILGLPDPDVIDIVVDEVIPQVRALA